MNILLILIGVLFVCWVLYSWIPVRNIEAPAYTVVSQAQGYEIREYGSSIIAATTITGAENRDDAARKGFPSVAGYIFGDNTKKDKIAMTAPVNTEKIAMTVPVNTETKEVEGTYTVSFVMPSAYTLATLPTPNDSRLELIEVPARTVAVKRFSWSSSEGTFKKHEAALERDGVETIGTTNVARYNVPWTIPFMLRNEVQVEVK